MRIVHLLLTSRFAGSERHALELAAAQSVEHEVTLILRRDGAAQRADAIAHRVDPRVTVEVVGNLFPSLQARRLLRRLRPDVAHAHLSAGSRALHGLGVATCSILSSENEAQVLAFLARTPDASAEPLDDRFGHTRGPGRQRLPGEGGMDGFFYARLRKG